MPNCNLALVIYVITLTEIYTLICTCILIRKHEFCLVVVFIGPGFVWSVHVHEKSSNVHVCPFELQITTGVMFYSTFYLGLCFILLSI